MGITWSNYTPITTLTNNDGSWLESSQVEAHGLVVVVSTNQQSGGVSPSINADGVEHSIIANQTSEPYQTQYTHHWQWAGWRRYWHHWYYRYYWYYPRWRWGWGWRRVSTAYNPVVTRVVLIVPHASGTLRVRAEGDGVFDHRVRIFGPNISPTANKVLRQIGFCQSLEVAKSEGTAAHMEVLTDDLLLAIGTDSSLSASQTNIELTGGITSQELFDVHPQKDGLATRVKLWRVSNGGTAELNYVHCGGGRSAFRYMPNADIGTVTPPAISEPRAYFEVQGLMNEVGEVERPDWFKALYHNLRRNETIGLRRAWLREVIERELDDVGRVSGVKAKRIEQWTIPDSAAGQVGSNGLLFEDRNEANARIVHHDNQW